MGRIRQRIDAADRAIIGRLARSRSGVLDAVLPRLGAAANKSVLWIAVAVALGATGRPATRRAAARGLGSLVLASAAAGLVAKPTSRRSRPDRRAIPLTRRPRRPPRSTSFPSGHAAAGAAFATGAALEAPVLAVPLGALAAAVGVSRVVTGAHHPSDVAAGAALGVGTAALTLRWCPRRTGTVRVPVRVGRGW